MQINKLDKMEARFISLEDQLSDPSVIADQNKWRELSKEHSELAEVVSKYREYKEVLDQAKEALEILGDKSQSDLHELAKEELSDAKKRVEELEQELKILLLPKDPNDDKIPMIARMSFLKSEPEQAVKRQRFLLQIF